MPHFSEAEQARITRAGQAAERDGHRTGTEIGLRGKALTAHKAIMGRWARFEAMQKIAGEQSRHQREQHRGNS